MKHCWLYKSIQHIVSLSWTKLGPTPGEFKNLEVQKIWNASRICVSSLRRGHANLLCIVPILVYVHLEWTREEHWASLIWAGVSLRHTTTRFLSRPFPTSCCCDEGRGGEAATGPLINLPGWEALVIKKTGPLRWGLAIALSARLTRMAGPSWAWPTATFLREGLRSRDPDKLDERRFFYSFLFSSN